MERHLILNNFGLDMIHIISTLILLVRISHMAPPQSIIILKVAPGQGTLHCSRPHIFIKCQVIFARGQPFRHTISCVLPNFLQRDNPKSQSVTASALKYSILPQPKLIIVRHRKTTVNTPIWQRKEGDGAQVTRP